MNNDDKFIDYMLDLEIILAYANRIELPQLIQKSIKDLGLDNEELTKIQKYIDEKIKSIEANEDIPSDEIPNRVMKRYAQGLLNIRKQMILEGSFFEDEQEVDSEEAKEED